MQQENVGTNAGTTEQQGAQQEDLADEFDKMEIPAFEIIEEPTDNKTKEENNEMQIEPASKPMDKETQRLFWVKESLKTYSLLKKNVYLDRKKKVVSEDDILVCNCIKVDPELLPQYEKINKKVSYNCGDGCLNRMVCYECEMDSCPCGEYCRNRRFQLHQNADVYPFPYEGKGWGLRAGSEIKKGQFVMQYIGEIFNINSEEGQIRNEAYSKSTCTYLMKIGGNEVIDPTFKGNMARFINHSCKPNCVTQKWHVLGEVCVGIFTLQDIKQDEELTFDYQFDIFKTPLTRCLCGAKECKGYLGVIPQDYTFETWKEKLANMPCSICGQSAEDDEDKLLMCEACNEGFHTFCLDPPLTKVPAGAWYCAKCAADQSKTEKKKQEEKTEPAWTMNAKLYELARKKRGKGPDIHAEKRLKKLLAEDEDDSKKMKSEDLERYESEYNLFKRLEYQAKSEMQGIKPEEGDDFVPIKKVKKEKPEAKKADKAEKSKDKKTDKKQNKKKTDTMAIEETEETPQPTQETQGSTLAVQKTSSAASGPVVEVAKGKSVERELKDMTLELFKQGFEADTKFQKQLADFEDTSGLERERNTVMVNMLELEVVKRNQQLLHKIGVTIFWDSPYSGSDYGDVFRKNYELTVNGNKKQMEIFDSLMSLVMKAAATVEKAKGNVEAIMLVPAIYLRRLIGHMHQTLNDFERDYGVMIQYDKNYVNDECYAMTKMTELRIKGQKEDIKKCYTAINALISKLTTVRLFYSQTEIYTIINNLPYLKRMVQPTEFRINRDFSLKELAHPFFYMKYKDKEVALVGTPEEVQNAEEVFKTLLAKELERKPTFCEAYYLWPMADLSKLTKFKSEFEKEVENAKFFFYEPIAPRKNITVHISAKSTSFAKAKQVLKEKFDEYQLVNQSFDDFQDNMKYHIVKYFFKFLHNSMIMNNTIFMKDWDLVSSEFEFLSKLPHAPSKRLLEDIFRRDTTLQLYITFVCDMSQDLIYENFGMTAADMIDIIRKKCNQFLRNNPIFSEKKYSSVLGRAESPHWGDHNDYVDKSDHHSVGSVDSRALGAPRSFTFNKYNDRRDRDYHRGSYRHDRYSDRDQVSDRGYDKRRPDRYGTNDRDYHWRDNRGDSRRKGSYFSNASRNDDRGDQAKFTRERSDEVPKPKEERTEAPKETQETTTQQTSQRTYFFSDKLEPVTGEKPPSQTLAPPPKIEVKTEVKEEVFSLASKQKESNEMEVEKASGTGSTAIEKEGTTTQTTQRVFRFTSEKEEDSSQQFKREGDRESTTGYKQSTSENKGYQSKYGSGGRDYHYQNRGSSYYHKDDYASKSYVSRRTGYQSGDYTRRYDRDTSRDYSRNRSGSRDRTRGYRDRSVERGSRDKGRSISRSRGRDSRSRGRDSRSRGRGSRSRGRGSRSRGRDSRSRGRDSRSRGRDSRSRGRYSRSRGRDSYSRGRSHSRGRRSPSRSRDREKNRRRSSRSPLRDSRTYSKNTSTYQTGDRSPGYRQQDQSWSYSQKNYTSYDRGTGQSDDRDWKRDSSYKKDYRDDRSRDDRTRDWQDSKDRRYYRESDRSYSQRDYHGYQDSNRGSYRDYHSRDEGGYRRDDYRDRDRRNSPGRYEKGYHSGKRDDAGGDYSKSYNKDSRDWNKGGSGYYGTRRGSRSRSRSKSRSRSNSYRHSYSRRRSHSNQRYNRDSRERSYRDDRYTSGTRNYRQADDRWRSNTYNRDTNDRDDYKKTQNQYPSSDSTNPPSSSNLKIEKPNTSYNEGGSWNRYGGDSRGGTQYDYKDKHHSGYRDYRGSNYNYRGGDRQSDDRGLHIQKRPRPASQERKESSAQEPSQPMTQQGQSQPSQGLPGVIKQNEGKTEASTIDY